MSNEWLLVIIGTLITAVGAVGTMLWRSQEKRIDLIQIDAKERVDKIQIIAKADIDAVASEMRLLEVRVRVLENNGGEPVRLIRETISSINAKIDHVAVTIQELTQAVMRLSIRRGDPVDEHDYRRDFGKQKTDPGRG